MKRFNLKQKNFIILIAILGILVGLFLFLYLRSQSELSKIKSQKDRESKDVINLISEVGKIILLPTGETPTVATVSDVDALKNSQPFFSQAKNGDKVLIYTKVKKAILYRPSTKKLIEVAPINLGSPSGSM